MVFLSIFFIFDFFHQFLTVFCIQVFFFFLYWFQFSHSVMSDALWPHGLQHARLPCPSPTPRIYSNSCPLHQWYYPTISPSVVPFFPPSIFPRIRVFSNESVLHIRWPKYWSFSFSINPSNQYSGLFSFRIDWLDLLSLGLEWKLTISIPVATAEFSRFAGISSAVISQHHLWGFEIAQLEFITSSSFVPSDAS